MIIAIDGYSATGKSTIANLLAKKIGFKHINSGLLYRIISHNLLTNGINKLNYQENISKIEFLTNQSCIDFESLDEDIPKLKTHEINDLGTQIAKLTFVRERITEAIRNAAVNSNIVIEGRDIGTVVFPNAEIKFFFKADTNIRAKRLGKKTNNNYELTILRIEDRDKEDETRNISPLICANDAIEIDTSYLTVDETLDLIERYVNEART